jgi:hypothetical protein
VSYGCLVDVNKITHTRTVKFYGIFEVKNASTKSVCYVMEYSHNIVYSH